MTTMNNTKLAVSTRIRAYALLKASDVIENDHCVELRKLWQIYADACTTENRIVGIKQTPYKYKSTDARDFFARRLPIVVVYKASEFGPVACIVKRLTGVAWSNLIEDLSWPAYDNLLKQNTLEKLNACVKPALGLASSDRDRLILKSILVKLTSASYLSNHGCGGIKYDRKSLQRCKQRVEDWFWKCDETNEKQNVTFRQPGSGRPSILEQFPDLTSCMLNLFETSGKGLQAHPRLICETLYANEKSWLNMPRAVSIMNQVYGISISLSTAYTYTENFRSGTCQAQRHHQGKGMNPGISLQRPTRDAGKSPSINEHYSMADLQYSLTGFFETGCILARDDKALVHTDVEVVQRPSKSWKRIQYSDHDWEKDSQRTLSITTYQFVQVRQISQPDFVSCLGSVGVCKTRLKGSGASLVKVHYLEPSTAFRHMNEMLFLMSLDNHMQHFMKNGQFISELLVTVDGGGDERPRNKSTQFCSVMIRWLLDLDRYKCHSLAEKASKYHSVERLHTAENYALSQTGVISSRMGHEKEVDDQGLFDSSKFEENMRLAQKEAVKRIDGVPYSGETIVSYEAPSTSDWVFIAEYEQKMKKFLAKDTTEHRIDNNFVIKPQGPIWNELCRKYDLHGEKAKSAVHIYNMMADPHTSFCTHYSYATYRADDEVRGPKPIKRYELQPLIDIRRLPEYHYLTYGEVTEVVEHFEEEGNIPQWLITPDFFLPSRNIQHLLQNHPTIFESDMKPLCNLIGVDRALILEYIKCKKEKEQYKVQQRELMESYKDNPLSRLTTAELKFLLHTYFGTPPHSGRKLKVDFLVALDKEIRCKQLSQVSVLNIIKEQFPSKFI